MGLLDALTGNNSRVELEYLAYGCNNTKVAKRGKKLIYNFFL
jgi:hypothetical protein